MIYWQNRILTNVKTLLGSACKNVSSTASASDTKFPTCGVKVVYNNAIADDLDFGDDEENAVYCGVSIDVYTKQSLQNAIDLIGIANQAMYRMGFKRIYGPEEIKDASHPEIHKMSARYARVIGSAETIERFET